MTSVFWAERLRVWLEVETVEDLRVLEAFLLEEAIACIAVRVCVRKDVVAG